MDLAFRRFEDNKSVLQTVLVVFTAIGLMAGSLTNAHAETVGEVAAVRGELFVHRELSVSKTTAEAKIYHRDKMETKERSRAKLDFMDDSSITLASDTMFNVLKYLEGKKGEKGSSIFQLVDGKVKAVSGRNKLEIHTPTAVAAARGTYFFVRVRTVDGRIVTDIACLSGLVDVRNLDKGIEGEVTVGVGKTTTITQDNPPTEPVPIPPKLLKDALNCVPVSMEFQE